MLWKVPAFWSKGCKSGCKRVVEIDGGFSWGWIGGIWGIEDSGAGGDKGGSFFGGGDYWLVLVVSKEEKSRYLEMVYDFVRLCQFYSLY